MQYLENGTRALHELFVGYVEKGAGQDLGSLEPTFGLNDQFLVLRGQDLSL